MVAVPHHLIEALPYNTLFLASSTQSAIVSIENGNVLHTIDYEQISQSPRCSAVLVLSDLESSSSSSEKQGTGAECLIALLGDDKELNVYIIKGLAPQKVALERIYTSYLPKRGVKMIWESTAENEVKTLVVGDRHGDVRSFAISSSSAEIDERDVKRRKVEGAGEDMEPEDDIDDSHPPHLGHVSLLTDLVLTSFSSPSSQSPSSFIITSDRDEHIRISRWGPRRAGHIALRYLLGSTDAIGGLCVIEHSQLKVLQEAVKTDAAKELCKQPLLLSTDSARLRIWSLHKDNEVGSRPDCLLVVDLYEAVHPYIKVDAQQERIRQRSFGKGRLESKKKVNNMTTPGHNIVEGKSKSPVVMVHLSTKVTDRDVYVSFVVDGASALFTFSLSKLLSSSPQDAASCVHVVDLGLPLLAQSFNSNQGETEVWLTCDVRYLENVQQSPLQGLRRATWSHEGHRWVEDSATHPLIQRQSQFQSKVTADIADSFILYDALTLYPKQEFERVSSVENFISPNGLVRGGLSTFKHKAMFKGNGIVNKDDSEQRRSNKVKAREDMLKRIEQALGESDIAKQEIEIEIEPQ